MGNKMCKKKVDNVDNPKSPSPFDRIITRLHLKRNSWKSDSHLHTKQVNRYEINPKDAKNGSALSHPMVKSKSSDWTEADLEVPDKEEAIHLKNPQLSFIFNDNSTPTPPPRKHKKSIREKIETVAKNSMQALQSSKKSDDSKKIENEPKKPIEEPLCIKKVVHYGCPCEDREICQHNKRDIPKNNQKRAEKEAKRKKNLSVVSLPNYNELKFSVANNSENSNLKYIDSSVSNSANSLPGETKKSPPIPAGKLENYMTRCRSFGSLLNNKLRVSKEPTDVESDDSFGGLEDWDLGILEHYNPKDASLPRPRKQPSNDANVLSDMEKLIVQEEQIEEITAPVRPVRRSESLIKKMSQETSEGSPEENKSRTPPPTPQSRMEGEDVPLITSFPLENDEGVVEHSSLMRILQEYSIKDAAAQKRNGNDEIVVEKMNINNIQKNILSSTPPPTVISSSPCIKERVSLKERSIGNVTTDFINTEKVCVS